LKKTWAVLVQTGREFMEDDCFQVSAALAYYAMFSLAPIVLLVLWIAGIVLDPSMVEGELRETLRTTLGDQGAAQVIAMVEILGKDPPGLTGSGLLAMASLIFGATGLVYQTQRALNKVWAVQPAPGRGVQSFVVKRLSSAALILFGAAPLLLISIAASALLSALTGPFSLLLPGELVELGLQVTEPLLSFALSTLIFALLFRVLPDAQVGWRDLFIGGAATSILFVAGETAIGIYLGRASVGSAFGAASSLAVLLVWVYYSTLSLFLGAEFTQVYARVLGGGVSPRKGAVRVKREVITPE
jgi:membrane protein